MLGGERGTEGELKARQYRETLVHSRVRAAGREPLKESWGQLEGKDLIWLFTILLLGFKLHFFCSGTQSPLKQNMELRSGGEEVGWCH